MAASSSVLDAVRSAVASIATCTPATAATLRDLLLLQEAGMPAKTSRPRSNTAPGQAANSNSRTKRNNDSSCDRGKLSAHQKLGLARHVANSTLKALGQAAKDCKTPPPASDPKLDGENITAGDGSGHHARRIARTGEHRRSLSVPLTPLHSRVLNRTPTEPPGNGKNPRPGTSSSASACAKAKDANLLATAECARAAFAALREVLDGGEVSCTETSIRDMDVVMGMSALCGKLIDAELYDHAIPELRQLRWRLESPCSGGDPASKTSATASTKATPHLVGDSRGPSSARQALVEAIDFNSCQASGQIRSLVVKTQLHALRILAAMKRIPTIEAALPYLRPEHASSPTNLALLCVDDREMGAEKTARHLERLAYYYSQLASPAPATDDKTGCDHRRSVSASSAFELQVLALEADLHARRLAGQGKDDDVVRRFLHKFSRFLDIFAQRRQDNRQSRTATYNTSHAAFSRIHRQVLAQGLRPAEGSKYPLAKIHQKLVDLAQESGQLDEAVAWARQLRNDTDPLKEKSAQVIFVAAQLLALYLGDPVKYLTDDKLIRQVVDGMQGQLQGEHEELAALLTTLGLVGKAAVSFLAVLRGIGAGRTGWKTRDGAGASSYQPPEAAKELLEDFVLACPRFCLRWLGKAPGPTNSTKDFLRYEQRKQFLLQPLQTLMKATFVVLAKHLTKGRAVVSWDRIHAVLGHSLSLAELMGDALGAEAESSNQPSEAASSYYVIISQLYFQLFLVLRKQTSDPTDRTPLWALQHAIKCVEDRPVQERDSAQFPHMLETVINLRISHGRSRAPDTLEAAETLRRSLVQDGVLESLAVALRVESPTVAWTGSNKKIGALFRAIRVEEECRQSLPQKTEDENPDWIAELPEEQQAAVLELRLSLLLLEGRNSPRSNSARSTVPSLDHPTVDALLRIYIPPRFPIRRLRILLHLLCAVTGQDYDDTTATRTSVMPVVRDAAQVGDVLQAGQNALGEDVGLASFLSHLKAFHASLTGLVAWYSDLDTGLRQPLSVWKKLVGACSDRQAVERCIDDIPGFLNHLQSVADFFRMKGMGSDVVVVLKLATDVCALIDEPNSDDLVHFTTHLAQQLCGLGQAELAEQQFLKAQECLEVRSDFNEKTKKGHQVPPVSLFAPVHFHLAFAEYHLVAAGSPIQASQQLKRAEAKYNSAAAAGDTTAASRAARMTLLGEAHYLCALLAADRGDSSNALIYAQESVRYISFEWSQLEALFVTAAGSGELASVSPDSSIAGQGQKATSEQSRTAGPHFWRLLHVQFRNLTYLSRMYAHFGMFRETVYYGKQAIRLAQTTGSEFYEARGAAWMGTVLAKANSPLKSLDTADEDNRTKSLKMADIATQFLSTTRHSSDLDSLAVADLAHQAVAMYLSLGDDENAAKMIARAEEITSRITILPRDEAGAPATSPDDAPSVKANDQLEAKAKPTRRTTRKATATSTAKAKETAHQTARAKASGVIASKASAKPTVPAASVVKALADVAESFVLAGLRASILINKASSWISSKEWTPALAALAEARQVSKQAAMMPQELMLRAACLVGMSLEQMGHHPVYSILQDSTLSFPAIALGSSNDKAALPASSSPRAPPKATAVARKGKSTALALPPSSSSCVEPLQDAHRCLVEAHALATISGDAGLVHRVFGMLQSVDLFLSATMSEPSAAPTVSRSLVSADGPQPAHSSRIAASHATCSAELARYLVWQRELKALALEKDRVKNDAPVWPSNMVTSSSTSDVFLVQEALVLESAASSSVNPHIDVGSASRRASLGFSPDLTKFQRIYIDILPKSWTVVSLSLSENQHDLLITRLRAGSSPFVVRLPMARAGLRDSHDDDDLSFAEGQAELLAIIRRSDEMCRVKVKDVATNEARTAWWGEREALDMRLYELLQNMERLWLGGFRGIFARPCDRPDLLAEFQRAVMATLDKHLPSRRKVNGRGKKKAAGAGKGSSSATSQGGAGGARKAAASGAAATLDPRIFELFVGLASASAVAAAGGHDHGSDSDNSDQDDDNDDNDDDDDDDDNGFLSDTTVEEGLMDLLYFVVDVLQLHGERNAYDEINFDAMVVETLDALHAYHHVASAAKKAGSEKAANADGGQEEEGTQHTILVVDKALHLFPWESLPCLEEQPVSRVPSLACLRRMILQQRPPPSAAVDSSPDRGRPAASTSSSSPSGKIDGAESALNYPAGHYVSATSGLYVLNPGGDLSGTQTTFEAALAAQFTPEKAEASQGTPLTSSSTTTTTPLSPSPQWRGIVGRAPSEEDLSAALVGADVMLYIGHGSGSQYMRGRTVRRLEPGCRAVTLLMGCSSASLPSIGDEWEPQGPTWNYLVAGCPAVVGALWDVTDRDTDKLTACMLERWGLVRPGAFDGVASLAAGGSSSSAKQKNKRGKKTATAAAAAAGKKREKSDKSGGVNATGKARGGEKGAEEKKKLSLVEAVTVARNSACRLRYMNAAAIVVYGIPVYVSR